MKQHEQERERGRGCELDKMEIGKERTNHKNYQPKHIDHGCTGPEYSEEKLRVEVEKAGVGILQAETEVTRLPQGINRL